MKNLETYINGKKKRHNLIYTSKVDTLLLNKKIIWGRKKAFCVTYSNCLNCKKIEKNRIHLFQISVVVSPIEVWSEISSHVIVSKVSVVRTSVGVVSPHA